MTTWSLARCAGDLVVGLAWQESAGEIEPEAQPGRAGTTTATGATGQPTLNGSKQWVVPGVGADGWLVTADSSTGPAVYWVPDANGRAAMRRRAARGRQHDGPAHAARRAHPRCASAGSWRRGPPGRRVRHRRRTRVAGGRVARGCAPGVRADPRAPEDASPVRQADRRQPGAATPHGRCVAADRALRSCLEQRAADAARARRAARHRRQPRQGAVCTCRIRGLPPGSAVPRGHGLHGRMRCRPLPQACVACIELAGQCRRASPAPPAAAATGCARRCRQRCRCAPRPRVSA